MAHIFIGAPRTIVVFVYILVLQSFLNKLAVNSVIPLLDYWDEIIILLMMPFAIKTSVNFILTWQGRFFFALFSLYLLMALLSTVTGDTKLLQSVYQFVLDLKYPIAFIYCLGAYQSGNSEKALDKLLINLLMINIPFVIFQFLTPQVYDAVFPNGEHSGVFAFGNGNTLARAAGVFWHPGLLAIFGVISSSYFASKLLTGVFVRQDKIFLVVSLFLLTLTLSRGEIGGFIVGLSVVVIVFHAKFYIKPLIIFVGLLFLIVASVIFEQFFIDAFREMGLISNYLTLAPRAAFLDTSISIASDNFPLGAGLGSFGGAAAVAYDSSLFYEYLIAYEWYFEYGLYLTDTYWPKLIAEAGFFGAFVYFLFLVLPGYFCYKTSPNLASSYSLWMITFLFIDSLSAPIYGSVFTIIGASFLIGNTIPAFRITNYNGDERC